MQVVLLFGKLLLEGPLWATFVDCVNVRCDRLL